MEKDKKTVFLELEIIEDYERITTRWYEREYNAGVLCNKRSDVEEEKRKTFGE